MANRNEQFEACRRAIDQFVRQAITVRTKLVEQERSAIEAVAIMKELGPVAGAEDEISTFLRLTRLTFDLTSRRALLKMQGMLMQAESMASAFSGPSGRFLRRHIQRMRDQVEAIKADCQRIKHSLAEVERAESSASR